MLGVVTTEMLKCCKILGHFRLLFFYLVTVARLGQQLKPPHAYYKMTIRL